MSPKSSSAIKLAINSLLIVLCFSISCENKEGPEGKQSLIDLISEPPGSNCPSGGYKITTGVDLNSNGFLEEQEIQNTKFICHGDGRNSLMSVLTESPGEMCPAGGYKIMVGTDLNSNDILDSIEVQHTEFICHGDVGHNSITSVFPEEAGEICPVGGVKIITGIDVNDNSILDSSEVHYTEYICNGEDGELDKQIRFDFSTIRNVATTNDRTSWSNCQFYRLQFFNIANYPDVDSVLFIATLETASANTECIVELYNYTDNQAIENGELRTNATVAQVGSKVNLLEYFPKKEIELGMRFRSSVNGSMVILRHPQLILYRK